MKQRTAILIAAALTAFMLAVSFAIVFAIRSQTSAQNVLAAPAPADGAPLAAEQVSNPVPQVQAIPTAKPLPTAVPQAKILTSDRAARIALAALPGSTLTKPPELVNYQGKMAYEVALTAGFVYVDAFSGKVLASAASVASDQPPQDTGGNGGGGGDGGAVAQNNPPAQDTTAPVDTGFQSPPSGGEHEYEGDHPEGEDHKSDEHKQSTENHPKKEKHKAEDKQHKSANDQEEHED